MSEQKSLVSPELESTYTYKNSQGLIEVIDISSGKRLMIQKTLEDIFNDKVNKAQLVKLPTGEEVWVELGLDLDLLPQSENYKYSNVMADLICQKVREGEALTKFCGKNGMPTYSTVCRWRKQNNEFDVLLRDARKDRAEVFMDKIVGIAEDAAQGRIDKDQVSAMKLATDGFERAAAAGDPTSYGKAKDQQPRVEHTIIFMSNVPDQVPGYKGERAVSPIKDAMEVSGGSGEAGESTNVAGIKDLPEREFVLDVES